MTSALSLKDVKKSYGDVPVVRGLSFDIAEGEVFALLGPNGAGKTTTISMIVGALEPTSGEISLFGVPGGMRKPEVRRRLGIVPQEISLYPELSGRENLRFFGRLYGLSGATLEQAIEEQVAALGMGEYVDRRVGPYSGGMKRKINLASALLHRPSLVLLDEPTVGVDPVSRAQIYEVIVKVSKEQGTAILLTTHLMEEAERLCDRIAIMTAGRIRTIGTLAELLAQVGGQDRMELQGTFPEGAEAKVQAAVDGILSARRTPPISEDAQESLVLMISGGSRAMPAVIAALVSIGAEVRGVSLRQAGLEAAFLSIVEADKPVA